MTRMRNKGQKPMEKHKKQQLIARGWKVGSANEFLGLTSGEAAYVELKLVLSDHLKQQRQQRKLTQGELGKLLHSSQSRVAKMEAGDPAVSLDLLVRSLLALGTSREDLAHMIAPQEPTTAT
jgi:DNA-binding XRE family transcriptional regulator